MKFYSLLDVGLTLFYLLAIIMVCWVIHKRIRHKAPENRLFMAAAMAKLGGIVGFVLIYTFYYAGGDTTMYHDSAQTVMGLIPQDISQFFEVWFGENTQNRLLYFDLTQGKPKFWGDVYAFNVVRFTIPFEFLAFGSYPATSLLVGMFSFTGLWQLYKVFCKLYPRIYGWIAGAIFFVPSVMFWGSGISKDTYTFMALCWCVASCYHLFVVRKRMVFYIITLVLSMAILIFVKPYVFVALLPALVIWGVWSALVRIKNLLVRFLVSPIVLVAALAVGTLVWVGLEQVMGDYSDIDSMLTKAKVSQEDLKRTAYAGNSFDIGSFDATIPSVLSKFPAATFAGIYRPLPNEAQNIVMLASAAENSIMILCTLATIVALALVFFRTLARDPIVLFCILFTLVFAFSIGLSTSNFGALVRFKIPMIPFFFMACFISWYRAGWIGKKPQGPTHSRSSSAPLPK